MSYLDQLRDMKEQHKYDRDDLNEIADAMTEELTAAEMWNILRVGFSTDELLENLEYIAKEADI